MLKSLIRLSFTQNTCIKCTLSQLVKPVENYLGKERKSESENSWPNLQIQDSVLGPLTEDISHVSTYLKPTFNIAAYANRSETVQELVKLGVNFHYIEKKNYEAVPFLLKLNYNEIKEYIFFINNLGVDAEHIGVIITKNPFIFKERIEDLEVRINYLEFKKFSKEMIARLITKNPFWLSNSTQDIDQKLGFFQANFTLTGDEVRQLAVLKPQLITFSQRNIKENIFAIKEEMGFNPADMKQIILQKPAIFMNGRSRLLKTFEYLHNVMKMPHEQIVQMPQVLTCRESRLRERHQFLARLNKAQFNPREPNYISPVDMVKDSDVIFATEIAKSSIEEYNMFLKTL